VDAVLHLAALNEVESERHPQQALRVNTLGTWNLLEESRRAGVSTFLYFSTFHVYGPGHTVIDENSVTRPVSHYAATHRMAELFVGLPSGQQRGIILRLSNGYGAPVHPAVNRWTLVVNDLCRQAVVEGRLVLKTPGTQARDFLAFPDLLAATRLLFSSTVEAGVYNVGGEHSVSIRTVAERVQAVWEEISGAQVPLEGPAASAGDRPVPVRFSIERLKALGYRPAGDPSAQMDQMIRETLRLCEKLG
jgi:UDP-glucose 4-epimerase